VDALRQVAAALYAGDEDPALIGAPQQLMGVETLTTGSAPDSAAEHVLRMPLPLAERAEVAVARAGDDLVVTVGTNRRVLALPTMLRRCDVVGGDFDGRELTVRFRARDGGGGNG
jgi:arsenite-transporting ATPase